MKGLRHSPLELISQIPCTGRWMKTTDENDSRHISLLYLRRPSEARKKKVGTVTGRALVAHCLYLFGIVADRVPLRAPSRCARLSVYDCFLCELKVSRFVQICVRSELAILEDFGPAALQRCVVRDHFVFHRITNPTLCIKGDVRLLQSLVWI